MKNSNQLKVLSLNAYIMGHITYQNILEKTFFEQFSEIQFQSLHLTDYYKKDLLGRLIYWLCSKRLPGSRKADYDFYRFRTELANSFFARRCLERALKTYQPDILHIHTQSIAYLTTSLFEKFPSVVSLDYTAALLAREHPSPAFITYRPIIAFEKRCFQSAAHIITWSNRARESVIHDYGISPQKITAIHPSIPLELFAGMTRSEIFTATKPRLLFVGNDFVRKGGEDVLAVFLDSFSDICELDIVTNAPVDLPAVPTIRVHRGTRPFSPEILQLYQSADIFVMPTYEEVYGIVFLEAMAAGLPCVGTTVMTVPELVQDRVSGFTIEPGDRKALRQVLFQLINEPTLRLSMGLAGRDFATQHFDAIVNCQRIADIFKGLK